MRRVNDVPWLVDDNGDLKGTEDAGDGDVRKLVFDGEPVAALAWDTADPGDLTIGAARWNDTSGTLQLLLKGGNVLLELGQQQLARVKNSTGAPLTKGTVVYSTGSDGANKTISKAQANAESTSSKTFGVLAEDIGNGNGGFVSTFGVVSGIDTSSLTEGATVYLSPSVAGGLTSVKPSAPDHIVVIGFCVRSHANNGALFVKITNGFELEELHNVKIENPQDGQVLKYQASTDLWINAAP